MAKSLRFASGGMEMDRASNAATIKPTSEFGFPVLSFLDKRSTKQSNAVVGVEMTPFMLFESSTDAPSASNTASSTIVSDTSLVSFDFGKPVFGSHCVRR